MSNHLLFNAKLSAIVWSWLIPPKWCCNKSPSGISGNDRAIEGIGLKPLLNGSEPGHHYARAILSQNSLAQHFGTGKSASNISEPPDSTLKDLPCTHALICGWQPSASSSKSIQNEPSWVMVTMRNNTQREQVARRVKKLFGSFVLPWAATFSGLYAPTIFFQRFLFSASGFEVPMGASFLYNGSARNPLASSNQTKVHIKALPAVLHYAMEDLGPPTDYHTPQPICTKEVVLNFGMRFGTLLLLCRGHSKERSM